MPDEIKVGHPEEQQALIERIVASAAFKTSKALPELLWFLFKNRNEKLAAKEIEERHFGQKITARGFSDRRTRVQVLELKKRLEQYEKENAEETLKVELPKAPESGGYQLKFTRVTGGVSACRRFWGAHLESDKPVSIVSDPLLVFWDTEKNMMFRFMDTNIEGLNRKRALDELKRMHAKEFREGLVPGHLYIDVGTVTGAELVRSFFRASGLEVALDLNKQRNNDWLKSSPIVIGNIRTNPPLNEIFESRESKALSYRLDESRYGWLSIRKPETEVDALKEIGVTLETDGSFTRTSPEMTFGVVSRMPNSYGGVMTFICSDSTYTTLQMIVALTDEKQLRELFIRMGWRVDRPVPETFEMLFLVKLFPFGSHDQGDKAELICWRPNPS